MDRLRAEMAQQEAHWKEAYDVLVAENNALKSSGSEALLASQWRQRYETLLKEKEDLENKLKMVCLFRVPIRVVVHAMKQRWIQSRRVKSCTRAYVGSPNTT